MLLKTIPGIEKEMTVIAAEILKILKEPKRP
jgi:hypothetical protein